MTIARPGWEIEIGGLRIAVEDQPIVVGRDPECDLPLRDSRVSWKHLRLEASNGGLKVTDLGSRNGTFINGKRLNTPSEVVTRETIIQIGSTRARLRERDIGIAPGARPFRRVALHRETIRIGRAPDNDIVLDEPNVSWHHAEVRPGSPPS